MVVLVPYDGSVPAQRAAERAFGQNADDEIVLLHVLEAAGMLEAGVDMVREKLKQKRDETATELSEEVSSLLETGDVDFRVETTVGKPAREIVQFAEDNDVDEIIIGSHGRTGVSRVLLGDVAETVVRRAPVTVTVVRPDGDA
jgi:nucleotide-binding universal stress UspA family protein